MVKKPSSKTSTSKKKKFALQLTGRSLMLWLCLLFLICGWMFVLGVLVGRGTAPINFDIQALQNELLALKESMLKQERSRSEAYLKEENFKNSFEFYEALKGEGTEAADIPAEEATPTIKTKTAPPLKKKAGRVKAETAVSPEPSQNGVLAVQVASTKDRPSAAAMVEKLLEKGYPAFSVRVDIPEKGIWHRVRVGYFENKTQAESARRQLLEEGYEGIVVRR